MRRTLTAVLLATTWPCWSATWSQWNGVTVGTSTGNISKWDGGTIGTSAGNIGAWNGLVSPGSVSYFTPVFVQHGAAASNTATAQADTLPSSVTAGNTIIVFQYCTFTSGTHTLSITDSASQSYTAAVAQTAVAGGNFALWEFDNSAAGSIAVTVHSSSACDRLYNFQVEVSHLNGFDQGPATATGLTSNNITSTTPGILFGLLTGGDGGTVPSPGTGYTIIDRSNTGAWNPGWEYQIVASAGTYNAVFTAATGTVQSSIVAIKAHTNP